MENLNDRIFELNAEGFTAGKIAQKLRVKKAVILEVLGESKNAGLGDILTDFTEVTGIKKVVEAVVDDCGCKARAEKLNEIFPNRKLNDLENEQFDFLDAFFTPKKPTSVNTATQKELVSIFNHVFKAKRKVTNCSPCLVNLIDDLFKIYERAK